MIFNLLNLNYLCTNRTATGGRSGSLPASRSSSICPPPPGRVLKNWLLGQSCQMDLSGLLSMSWTIKSLSGWESGGLDSSGEGLVLINGHSGQAQEPLWDLIQTLQFCHSHSSRWWQGKCVCTVQNLARITFIRCHLQTAERNSLLSRPILSKKAGRIDMSSRQKGKWEGHRTHR